MIKSNSVPVTYFSNNSCVLEQPRKMKINAHAQKFHFRLANKLLIFRALIINSISFCIKISRITFLIIVSMDFAKNRKLLKLLSFVCKNLIKNCCKIFIFLNNTKRMLNYVKNLCINVNLTKNVNLYHYLQKN